MTDGLASWNNGVAKSAIVDFVARVTKEGGADYVPPADRIATFDNDGTLWSEQPLQVQISERAYGIPRAQVVGTSGKLKVDVKDGRMVLTKLGDLNSFDDREAKVQNISLHIGRRPLLAFGNSDGDLAMLRYTKTGPGPRLALLVHHDDNEREVAYDRDFKLSPLAEALDKAEEYGITVVSMKRDWQTVFG